MPDTDQQIIERCLAGHADEFRHLVRRHQRPVVAYLATRLGTMVSAEAAAQEAFVRAFCNLRKLRKQDAFLSWILGIAQHISDEFVRRERVESRRRVPLGAAQELPCEAPDGCQSHGIIHAVVAELTSPLREVVLLRFYADRSCKDISEQLGIPVSTVTKRLSRAYAQMRERLATAPTGE